jgi:PAS domain S-box-containing protein
MQDRDKTKNQLIAELELLRGEVAALKQTGRSRPQTHLPQTTPAAANLTIVLIDDSEVDRATYRRYLMEDRDRSYQIVEFDNGEDALEWCQQNIPDIFLLDYFLPDMDGLELLQQLQQLTGRNTLPVIMFTGQGNLQIAVDLLKSGAQDYLDKSQITPQILQKSISYILRQSQLIREREWQQQQQQLLGKTALSIRDSLKLEDILNTTVREVKNILLCDRVIIFKFSAEWGGTVLVESVADDCMAILPLQIYDPCIGKDYVEPFKQGLITAKSDIYNSGISPCHIEFLESLQVRANLVVPITKGDELWGLLVVHHCTAPREWQASEIELLRQLSAQVSIAIQQADLFEQLQAELSERQLAEIALQENEQKLQLFIKYAPASIVMFDREMRYVAASQRWVDDFRLNSSESIIGRSHYEVFPNIPEQWKHYHQSSLAGAIEKCDEDFFVSLDGSEQWLRWEIHPWYRSNGDIGGIILFTENITARKQAQIALQQLNAELEQRVIERTAELTEVNDRLLVTLLEKEHAYQRLEEQAQLLDLARDSIITWDLNSVITFWNQGAEFMYGWTKAEAFWQESHTLLKTQFPQPLAEIEAQLLEQGYWEGELIHFTKDDRAITVYSRWVAQKDRAGRVIKILEINNDISDRKQAELALQQYINQVEDLYNKAPCGYHSLNAEGTIVRINDTELNLLGYTRDEILYKKNFCDLIVLENKKNFDSSFPVFKKQGWIDNLEFQMLNKDGSTRWVNLNATAIYDEAGNFLMSRSSLFDISDRKHAEANLLQKSKQEHLLWSITQAIRQSLDFHAILNTAVAEVRQILQTDRAAIYRFNQDWSGDFVVESVGEDWVKLVECGVGKIWADTYLQETQGGRFRNKESFVINDIYRAGLQPCHIELLEQFQAKAYAISPIFSGETLWGLLAIYENATPRDWQSWEVELLEQIASQLSIAIQQSELYEQLQIELQERQQAEATIREAERRWRSLLDNVQLIVVGLDIGGNVNYVNPFFLKLTGYTNLEVLGENWFKNFLTSSNKPSIQVVSSEVLAHKYHPYYQNSILLKSGEERFIAWNNTILQDSEGTIIGTISIGEDITERKKIDEIKDEFIGIVSHELRTPLTAIQMSLGLIQTGIYDKKPEKSRRMIEIALLDTHRLVNLVNDILDLERMDSGRVVFEKTVCKAADLMQQAIERIQAIATQEQITLTFTPTDVEVWAAPDTIIQTLTNLLGNALKFSPAQSTIHLSAEIQTDFVLFQVCDRGRGIPADQLELIFGRFQQVDASDSREKGGTGLGLSICQSIIERHGGKIWAESSLGEGSTFFFTLPLPTIEF